MGEIKEYRTRGQASTDFLIITGFLFLVLIPIIIFGFNNQKEGEGLISTSQLNSFVIELSDAAREVYYLGPPAKITLKFYMPKNIKNITIEKNYVFFKINTINGDTDMSMTLPFNVTGGISTAEGIKNIVLEARGDDVWIHE